MNNFCTNCGARCQDAVNFCTNCGAPQQAAVTPLHHAVPSIPAARKGSDGTQDLRMKFFTDASLIVPTLRITDAACVVMTDLSRLRRILGPNYLPLESRIERFVNSPRSGLTYYLLDCGNTYLGFPPPDEWREYVRLLQLARESLSRRTGATMVSLFIIGDDRIIPMPRLENPVGPDDDVDTDYPYASLSTLNPWETMETASLLVGRLPVGTDGTSAARYLDNQMLATSGSASPSTFGIGAERWEGSSRATFGLFSNGDVHMSPPVSARNLSTVLREDAELLYFNLHGSNEPDEPGWFGESHEGQYPVAIRPDHLARMRKPNVVGVEACYGAKFSGLLPEASNLLQALGSTTLGFVGSSRIAFGPSEPPISMADIAVGHFLRNVAKGQSLGSAFMEARNELWDDIEENGHSRLTVLEFNLFGDPNYVVFPTSKLASLAGTAPREQGTAGRLLQSIRFQAGESRRKINKSMRRLSPAEMISSEVQQALQRCKRIAQSMSIPLPRGCQKPDPMIAVTEVGGTRNVVLNYRVSAGSVPVGCALVQDFQSAQVKGIYVYR
jgi:hypothetical protein